MRAGDDIHTLTAGSIRYEDPLPEVEVTLRVFRGTPQETGALVDYRVPLLPGMVVLDAIHYVQQHLAGDLACRWNCKAAKCGSCSAEVNGRPRLMCKVRIDELGTDTITVLPMRAFPLVKDLVTDVSGSYAVDRQIPAFTPDPGQPQPWRILPEDVARLYEFRRCIECFLCQDVCHIIRTHQTARYYGPRFFLKTAFLEMHPKDTLDRRERLHGEGGLGYSNITKCCTEVCPEHIHITDNSIIPLKERVNDVHWDPLRWLGRKVRGR